MSNMRVGRVGWSLPTRYGLMPSSAARARARGNSGAVLLPRRRGRLRSLFAAAGLSEVETFTEARIASFEAYFAPIEEGQGPTGRVRGTPGRGPARRVRRGPPPVGGRGRPPHGGRGGTSVRLWAAVARSGWVSRLAQIPGHRQFRWRGLETDSPL